MMHVHPPDAAGMSADRLQRLDAAMTNFTRDDRIPGILTLLQRRAKIVHVGRYGHLDVANQAPVTDDALFRIYSMTKPIVSLALMMLFEEGGFSLLDPVARFIPAFARTKVYAGSGSLGHRLVAQNPALNLHHLLTHTGGLSYGWFFDHPVEADYRAVIPGLFDRGRSLAEVVDTLAGLPLLFQPGAAWRYSYATDVLGRVVEVIAGAPLGAVLEQRIFKPLGMVDTSFHVPAGKVDRLAPIYTSPQLFDPIPFPPAEVPLVGDVTQPTACPSAGAGLVSTLADYLAWCRCLMDETRLPGGGRLLSRKTFELMRADHVPRALRPLLIGDRYLDHGFGLGFRIMTDLGDARAPSSVGEYGWAGAAGTYFWIDPAEDFIGLMMTQYMPTEPYPFRERFKILAYQAIEE